MTTGGKYWVPFEVEGAGPEYDGTWHVLKSDPRPITGHIQSRYARPWRLGPGPQPSADALPGDPRSVREVLGLMASGWSHEAREFLREVLQGDPRAGESWGSQDVRNAWLWATLPAPKPPYRYATTEVRKRLWAELNAARDGSPRWTRDYWLGLTDIDGVPYYPPFGWHSAWRPSAAAEERHRFRMAWGVAARRHAAEVAAGFIDPSAPTPFDHSLHPSSTARVAIPSHSRARWLLERVLADHLPDLHTWDPHEVLVRGVAARPNGSLLDLIHAAHPDGVFHGLNDRPRRRPGATLGPAASPFLGRAPSSAIKRCFWETFGRQRLDHATFTLIIMAVGLGLVHQWRTGRLHRFSRDEIRGRVDRLMGLVRGAERGVAESPRNRGDSVDVNKSRCRP